MRSDPVSRMTRRTACLAAAALLVAPAQSLSPSPPLPPAVNTSWVAHYTFCNSSLLLLPEAQAAFREGVATALQDYTNATQEYQSQDVTVVSAAAARRRLHTDAAAALAVSFLVRSSNNTTTFLAMGNVTGSGALLEALRDAFFRRRLPPPTALAAPPPGSHAVSCQSDRLCSAAVALSAALLGLFAVLVALSTHLHLRRLRAQRSKTRLHGWFQPARRNVAPEERPGEEPEAPFSLRTLAMGDVDSSSELTSTVLRPGAHAAPGPALDAGQ